MKTVICHDQAEWDAFVTAHGGHPLQLWGWGDVKAAHGWTAQRVFLHDDDRVVAIQLLRRQLPSPLGAIWYSPRGPVFDGGTIEQALDLVAQYGRTLDGVALRVEPETTIKSLAEPWRRSSDTVLMHDTIILDLSRSAADLQADMTKKTRQYIRKSSKDVTVRRLNADDIAACYQVYQSTAVRAGFNLHALDYYRDVHHHLGDASMLYGAYDESGELLSFLWLAQTPAVAFELYGGMTEVGQTQRANYALKWHAIDEAQAAGVSRYDFNGLVSDNVSTFKKGFASTTTQLVGTYELPLSPWYTVWRLGFRSAKKLLQRIKARR